MISISKSEITPSSTACSIGYSAITGIFSSLYKFALVSHANVPVNPNTTLLFLNNSLHTSI